MSVPAVQIGAMTPGLQVGATEDKNQELPEGRDVQSSQPRFGAIEPLVGLRSAPVRELEVVPIRGRSKWRVFRQKVLPVVVFLAAVAVIILLWPGY